MRKIIQIEGNTALCDDGTLWLFEIIDTSDEDGKSVITNWTKVGGVPQHEEDAHKAFTGNEA